MFIYTITTVNKEDTRCVGFFTDRNQAIEAVKNNRCDIYEAGCYPYAVIERIKEGLYTYDEKPLWFKYDEKEEVYKSSKRPDFIKPYSVGFGIG